MSNPSKDAHLMERLFGYYRCYVLEGDDWIVLFSAIGILLGLVLSIYMALLVLVITSVKIYISYTASRVMLHIVTYIGLLGVARLGVW